MAERPRVVPALRRALGRPSDRELADHVPDRWPGDRSKGRLRATQKIDEWPGEDHDGTSVRAGAKVMLEKGFISEYQRITSLQDLIDFLRRPVSAGGGPVLIVIDWHQGMFSPVYEQDALGDYRWLLIPTGAVAGGHAVLVNGVNVPRETFRILNSWGRDWGVDGRASIRFADMDDLLFSQGGDAWRYVEQRPAT